MVAYYDHQVLPIPGSSNVDRVNSNIRAANLELSKSDLDRIQEVLKAYPVHGDRYAGPAMAALVSAVSRCKRASG